MSTKLSFSQTQTNSRGEDQSMLTITVCYDPENMEAVVDSVQTLDYKSLQVTDITHIMTEQYPAALESMMECADWDAMYLEQQQPSPSFLFQDICRIAYAGIMPQDRLNKMIGGAK
jgi:hypothetical protein